jgi:hypothetical protein
MQGSVCTRYDLSAARVLRMPLSAVAFPLA